MRDGFGRDGLVVLAEADYLRQEAHVGAAVLGSVAQRWL
jgi:hypothetical protein